MSEGPVNFGKPLMWIVILGCAGGGYYAYTHMPATYDGAGWSVKMPHGWEAQNANDPSDATKITGTGPLPKLPTGEEQSGVMWAKVVYHGTLDWNLFQTNNLPGTPDVTEDVDIDYKKSRLFTYEDQVTRYQGAMVDRGDAMIIVAFGCIKANFPGNKAIFDNAVRSIRCQR